MSVGISVIVGDRVRSTPVSSIIGSFHPPPDGGGTVRGDENGVWEGEPAQAHPPTIIGGVFEASEARLVQEAPGCVPLPSLPTRSSASTPGRWLSSARVEGPSPRAQRSIAVIPFALTAACWSYRASPKVSVLDVRLTYFMLRPSRGNDILLAADSAGNERTMPGSPLRRMGDGFRARTLARWCFAPETGPRG